MKLKEHHDCLVSRPYWAAFSCQYQEVIAHADNHLQSIGLPKSKQKGLHS